MEWKDIGDKIVDFVPELGKIVGTIVPGAALAGDALAAIGRAFGLGSEPTPEQVNRAIVNDPEWKLKFVIADNEFKLEQRRQEIEEMKVIIGSVKDAQGRQIEHEKITGKSDTNLYAIAWTVIVGFLLLVIFLLYVKVPEDQSGVIFMLFGSLATGFGQVLGYFFGSSASSESKTKLLSMIKK